jgi:hypothetical protein
MGTTNYDASRITQRKRAVALNTWYNANNAAVANGASVLREQPSMQMGEVLNQRVLSKAFYTPNGGCPCSQDVTANAGGGNANNVQ